MIVGGTLPKRLKTSKSVSRWVRNNPLYPFVFRFLVLAGGYVKVGCENTLRVFVGVMFLVCKNPPQGNLRLG